MAEVRYIGPHDEVSIHSPATGEQVGVVKQGHKIKVPDDVAKALSDETFERVKDDKKKES